MEYLWCYTGSMVLRLIVACAFVASALLFAEVARANKWVSGERARKLIHILIGVWGAWLPLWLSWRAIQTLGLLLIIGVFIANNQKWIKSITGVTRSTIGEYFFPIVLTGLAVFFQRPVIFAASMLMLGVADGMAAVIGTRYGKKTRFKIIGQTKSKHGTITFFVIALSIVYGTIAFMHPELVFSSIASGLVTLLISVAFSLVITIAELTSSHGADNITVPVLTAIGLTILQ